VGLHETRGGALAANTAALVDTMLPTAIAFLLEKLGKLECACIVNDKAVSLLVGALGPSTLAICLAFNCTGGSFDVVNQEARVHFKGAHATHAWQMVKFAGAFDSVLGLPKKKKSRTCHLSLGVVLRSSRLCPSLMQPVEANLCCVVEKRSITLPESHFDDMLNLAIKLQKVICESGVDAVCELDLLTDAGKSHPFEDGGQTP
jgi:hypothetical protein